MRLLVELAYARCRCRSCRVDRLEWVWYMAHADPAAFMIRFAPLPPVCRHPQPVPAFGCALALAGLAPGLHLAPRSTLPSTPA